ncbi:MAG: type VI secretion system baseplate subunit TssF [Oleispira sp.]|nr:type VI secretion system baseplate subunit TssF [Oleispira sp.]
MKTESYQAELQNLKDNAREFARKYPALAPHLAGSSSDPDVERILQGTAFLSAGIQERLDTDFPEFAQSILRLVAPDYLKEIPATTIIEFKPRNILNNVITINEGAKLDSQKVAGISCRFHSCTEVKIYPLTINSCELNQTSNSSELDIIINNTSLANSEVYLSELPLHIAGDYIDASEIYYLLTNKLESISIVQGQQVTELTKADISPMGWNQDFNLLENHKTSLHSYRRLQEYFINKYKFLFVNLSGLDDKAALPKAFKLRFKFSKNTHGLQVNKNSFKLFCTPAINLFETDAEPIPLTHKQSDLRLNPIRNSNNQLTVHSLLSVNGQNRRSTEKNTYIDFSLAAKEQASHPVYELIQKYTGPQEVDSILRISFPTGYELPMREVLTAKLRCSNGAITQQLKLGDVNVNTPDVPDLVSFSNVSAISEYIAPITDGSILWKLLAHLTVNYLPIADLDNLKTLLNLYNPTEKSDAKDHAANKKRINSLKEMTNTPCQRLHRGYLIRGQRIELAVDSTGFTSTGDLYLFGELIYSVLKQFADINSFVELNINNLNNGEQLTWQPSLQNR